MPDLTRVLCNGGPIQGSAYNSLTGLHWGIWFKISWQGQADKVLSFPNQGV